MLHWRVLLKIHSDLGLDCYQDSPCWLLPVHRSFFLFLIQNPQLKRQLLALHELWRWPWGMVLAESRAYFFCTWLNRAKTKGWVRMGTSRITPYPVACSEFCGQLLCLRAHTIGVLVITRCDLMICWHYNTDITPLFTKPVLNLCASCSDRFVM